MFSLLTTTRSRKSTASSATAIACLSTSETPAPVRTARAPLAARRRRALIDSQRERTSQTARLPSRYNVVYFSRLPRDAAQPAYVNSERPAYGGHVRLRQHDQEAAPGFLA